MDIRPIHDESDYQAALQAASVSFDHEPELGTPQADHFELLLALIQTWENRHFPVLLAEP